jgi:hypothetical protein
MAAKKKNDRPQKPKLNENGKRNTRPMIYTSEFVQSEVEGMLELLRSDEEIIYKKELFLDKPYTCVQFSIWANNFRENDLISKALSKIEEICELRAVKGGLSGKFNAAFTGLHMKNNFGWKDRSDMTSNDSEIGVILYPTK